ncbi:class IV adenylate cyclase [Iodobacter fluviatilis]|uniref:Adenylate cyclase n=1 Tax=Iodobacter fluviatilis TaxID=537 RepID=A0A7G3GEY4_9NEIS|nr:class IV adenylate cyclase [Iodobacter fluviatilis]QBC45245.1 adenylate cyclase [Iodobacter fluviatilis]
MARNIEIKAHIDSIAALIPILESLSNTAPIEIIQDDTFFACENGRLKLRAFTDGSGKLIFYRRANRLGPKESFYVISTTAEPDALREVLAYSNGKIGRVEKHRTFYLCGRTRVHLDRVKGLGEFLELEVVLAENETAEAGQVEAQQLMAKLGIQAEQLIEIAYLDLLAAKNHT